jgi:mRNA interferase MazF
MERLSIGDVVLVPFPFTDFSNRKNRPALIISKFGADFMICAITSKFVNDEYAIEITNRDFKIGGILKLSYIKPNIIHTINCKIVKKKLGSLRKDKLKEVLDCIRDLI